VGLVDDGAGFLAVQAGQVDAQLHLDAEAVGDGADADDALDGGVLRQVVLVPGGDELQGAQESGGVAGREQLLGVGAFAAGTAQFTGGGQADVEYAVGGDGATVTAAGGFCVGAVENVFDAHGDFLR
jgi:hypothetical protein